MIGKDSHIFMHEKGASAWDRKLDWAAEYVKRITDKLRNEVEEKLTLEKTERDAGESEMKASIQKNDEAISRLEIQHGLDTAEMNEQCDNIKSSISDIQAQVTENYMSLLNLREVSKEALRLKPLPEEHKDDLNVTETGFYLDTQDKTYSNGVAAPGILMVFRVEELDETYRFYLSYQTGLFVQMNRSTWLKP